MIQIDCKYCRKKYRFGINLGKNSQIGNLTLLSNCPFCRTENRLVLDGTYYLNEIGVLTKVGSYLSTIGNSDTTIQEFLDKSRNLNIANHSDIYKYLDFVKNISSKIYDVFNQVKIENSNLSVAILIFIAIAVWYLLTQTFHTTNSIDPIIPKKIEVL